MRSRGPETGVADLFELLVYSMSGESEIMDAGGDGGRAFFDGLTTHHQ